MQEFATSQGRVRGARVRTPDGDAIAVLGVPTAKVPERFRPAVPADRWAGLRVSAQGPLAWQGAGSAGALPMSEQDCLTANVWLPATQSDPRAVLVWVHGGAHLVGSNGDPLCDGARLAAAQDLIVAAISYRLGAFGHLRLDHLLGDDYADAGNLALGDALSGITWVRDEIAAFGGDPSRITVMGQSAGGAIVSFLLAESDDEAPFQRVIIESAPAERAHTPEQAAEVTAELLYEIGGRGADPRDLLRAPAPEIIAAQQRVVERWQGALRGPATPFRPIIDGRFVHDLPRRRIADGCGIAIDALIGTARNEASASVDLMHLAAHDALRALESELESMGRGGEAGSYISACAEDDRRMLTPAEVLESLVTDRHYRGPTNRLLEARRRTGARTFAYLFAWPRPDTASWSRRAGHTLELPFVFRHLDDSAAAVEEVGDAPPRGLSESMSALWASFVRSGSPHAASVAQWPPFAEGRATLVLDEQIDVVHDPFAGRRRWASSRDVGRWSPASAE